MYSAPQLVYSQLADPTELNSIDAARTAPQGATEIVSLCIQLINKLPKWADSLSIEDIKCRFLSMERCMTGLLQAFPGDYVLQFDKARI